ncbi:MAG: DNA polymerase I [Clostridia bacterium]|nr:DNA polymerase I [Clostridia bacterium]
METLMIIDGNSIINRAYYGVRPLSTKEGIPTNGIFGFMNILLKHLEEVKPEYLLVAFDLKAPTFRHKEYSEYKAQRKGMPEDLAEQLPHLKELLAAMNVKMLSQEGFEADDIIGTVAARCEKEGISCVIVTGDKDDLQLASEKTHILLTTTRMGQTTVEDFDRDAFIEKYKITPHEFIDVKALMGDSSDNIPGVAGIGEKTAFTLIESFHSLEGVYENIDSDIIKKAQRQKLLEGRDSAFMSRRLATIVCDMPLELDFEQARRGAYNNTALIAKLNELEMKKLADRLGVEENEAVFEEVEVSSADDEVLKKLEGMEKLFFIIEGEEVQFVCEGVYSAPTEALKTAFENENIEKLTVDYKKTKHFLKNMGISLKGKYYDFAIARYVLDPSRKSYETDSLCHEFNLPPSVQSLPLLYDAQRKLIEERGQEKLLYEIELPLCEVLYSMEIAGFMVNRDALSDFADMLGERLSAIEEAIYFMAGKKFNINSTKQLGVILFEEMGLPVVKKTKTGYSTDSEVLDKLSGKHEIVDLIQEYRVLMKLKSTYADGLLTVVAPDGRIHSTLNQTITQTGRLSSTEPNLQNIPTRTSLGREIRKMFVASEGNYLVGADYSQIELRVLAHISKDKNMTDAFLHDIDIHRMTASQVFNVPDFLVTDEMRSAAKTVNFGIIYGQGDFGLSKELKISVKNARAYIESYFTKYGGVREYMTETIEKAREEGYVTTIFGRRRYIEELKAKNRNLVAFGERCAMNTPIQGSAADIIKIAMVNVYNALREKCPDSRLVMQVHDELIVEAPEKDVETVAAILKEEMEKAVELNVPLIADVKSGKSWYDTK